MFNDILVRDELVALAILVLGVILARLASKGIGALVGDIPLRVSVTDSVADVLAQMRDLDEEIQGIVAVVDTGGHYVGVLDRWRLLLRNPSAGTVKDYLVIVKAVHPETQITAVAMREEWLRYNWLPVVDHRRRVLGSVTREKVIRAASTQSGRAPGGREVLLDLLADLVYFCEAVLFRTLYRKESR